MLTKVAFFSLLRPTSGRDVSSPLRRVLQPALFRQSSRYDQGLDYHEQRTSLPVRLSSSVSSNVPSSLRRVFFPSIPHQTLTDGPFNVFISWVKRLNPRYRAAHRRSTAYVVERVEKAREKIRGGGEIGKVESMVSLPSSLVASQISEKPTRCVCSQIDIIMRKEARDGEGQVMAEDELRDELSTCESVPKYLSSIITDRSIFILYLTQSWSLDLTPRGQLVHSWAVRFVPLDALTFLPFSRSSTQLWVSSLP